MTALLELRGISRSYWRGPHELRVLEDVSLAVRAGEMVGIYGQRGAGKTTLLRIAAGFEPPDGGMVTYRGENLARCSRRELARLHREAIGWVERSGPQSGELPIRTYVALPLYRRHGPTRAQRRAVETLARVGAEDVAELPWSSLSDTSRVLVAVAHALVREPRMLLVDDPTAGLGIVDRERVVGLLRDAAQEDGVAVLMAVPDMPAMLHAHEVRALSRGRLLAPAERDARGTVIPFPGSERSA
jgi:ABC-type lipoprotein export system ATPase subunit